MFEYILYAALCGGFIIGPININDGWKKIKNTQPYFHIMYLIDYDKYKENGVYLFFQGIIVLLCAVWILYLLLFTFDDKFGYLSKLQVLLGLS